MRSAVRPPDAVRRAAEHLGADPAALRRLSSGTSNGVWSLPDPPLVLTAFGRHHDLASLQARLRTVRALEGRVPFVRLVRGGLLLVGPAAEPVAVWERLALLPGRPDDAQVGAVLARLHAVPLDALPGAAGLPDLHDLEPARAQVRALRDDGVPARVCAVLAEVAERLAAELEPLPGERVLVHGDLHPPNVLHTASGPFLCDVDELGRASPWYDLAFLLDPGRRPGLRPEQRAALLAGYRAAGGAEGPGPAQVLALSRAAHLRRTLRELRLHRDAGGGRSAQALEGAVWDRVRVGGWAAALRDWSTPQHPVFCLPRGAQLRLLLRPLPRRVDRPV